MSHVKKHPFSIEEDHQILQFVLAHGPNNWGQLSSVLGRSAKQIRERWNGHLNPRINKGPWTHEEDLILFEKQQVLGNKWAEISKFLPGRTDTIVKNRWNTSIKNRLQEFLVSPAPSPITSPYETTNKPKVSLDWLPNINGISAAFPLLKPGFSANFNDIPPLIVNPK